MADSFDRGDRARKFTEELQFIDAPDHPSVRELAAYFERKRGNRDLLDRADIDPVEIARFMPNMIIAESVDEGRDFRTRLFGTALVELLGEERTGKLFSDFAEEGAAFSSRKPVFVNVPFAASGRLYLIGHCLSVPMTAGGTEPVQMIGALFVARADQPAR
jgi:hypothetical protein